MENLMAKFRRRNAPPANLDRGKLSVSSDKGGTWQPVGGLMSPETAKFISRASGTFRRRTPEVLAQLNRPDRASSVVEDTACRRCTAVEGEPCRKANGKRRRPHADHLAAFQAA